MILSHTISLPELLWTLWCIPGLTFLIKLTRKAYKDWRWLIGNNINSVRQYAAVNNMIVFSTMTLTQFIFVIIGIVAMMLPTAKEGIISPFTYVLTALFMFASLAKSVLAGIISIRYENLIDKIESGHWVITVNKEKNGSQDATLI